MFQAFRRSPALKLFGLAAAVALPVSAAHAQSRSVDTPVTGPPLAQPTGSIAPDAGPARPASPDFQRYNALGLKGLDIPWPKTSDTLIGNAGGVRDWLADRGIGFLGLNIAAFNYDMLQNDHGYRGRQLYNGQRLTRTLTTISMTTTYDLGRIGLEGGQLAFTGVYITNSFNRVNGPNSLRVDRLSYYQSLFDNMIEVKLGYIDNGSEFLGVNTGGNLATGNLGPQATIPYQVGLSYLGFQAPALNIRVNARNHFYSKIGLQRSLVPGGANAEVAFNKHGLRFRPPGTGLLTIAEFGWNRPASNGVRSTWFRTGGIYNTTRYKRFAGGTATNWAGFAALDRQLIQIDPSKPGRGLYVGATANYAPPQQNLFTRYFEGRVYGIGLIRRQPFDMASLVINRNIYSREGLLARTAPGQGNYKQTTSAIASYAYRVTPGLYLQPGVGVVNHPLFSPRFGTAVNAYLTITTLL